MLLITYSAIPSNMKRYEKVLLALLGLALVWLAAPTRGATGLFTMLLWLLAGSYLVGGYWLFRTPPTPPASFRILGGICLAASVLGLLPAIELRAQPHDLLLPAASGVFAFVLLVYGKRNQEAAALKPLLLRTLVVFGLCAFFAYPPHYVYSLPTCTAPSEPQQRVFNS
ncbi:hypothetical protein KBK19_13640 [Microvirga sp. STR05]|uniref:Uncharacterized protein n=1 Tax=Hymenobacter duratus TaxID=2771356 RepID=A0ABR8JL12_9BACT|nr:hypothetical protein [Hymenobacter duratus]MBD2716080.1 hypothetical protein [Hymenobacter duratus]MBR7950994.1 hypothetical protein [Microvirga sp. STR05]